MAKPPMISTAKELYRAAVAMHEMTRLAAPHLKPRGDDQPAVYLGYYFNLGFAVELYLKAFLRDATGGDVLKYGHDLDALLKAALAKGFAFQELAMADLVKIIGPEHRKLKFRYAEGATNFTYINQLDLVEVVLTACSDGMAHLR
ncbi:hypothetical protein [Sinorhizobium meliloti]|uniref:hypothetical protein n=1 Tax=Rhizobium meliloti TaxID=382 RepID=UPI000FD52128|nr:hypothetical protein [Sinorhizobium meliloti]MDW9668081.1 hypothetical protein [Sinorhizobium meliloti]RVG47499.1 hypothetical protein CN224_31925 [Sinorhizobium meliloti]RVJ93086.1 hypothetical protein CN169_12795 [Sinorhizobium meliloti]